jgi:MFS family permease
MIDSQISLNTAVAKTTFPPGLNNAFRFATFNAFSFQIVISSPMVLYAKSLGASATVLGVIAGMMPLLVIFQIPAARYVSSVGYKRFVYAGWGMRVMFIFAMALVPLTGAFLNSTNRLALMLLLLFAFNLSRGISSCAWLPWITSLVPSPIRGKYLAREAACVNLASFICFLLAGACLAEEPRPWRFAVLFVFSAVMGVASLVFLKRIPDVTPPKEEFTSSAEVPWRAMVRHPPFRKLLRLLIGWSLAYGGITAFTVAFLKTQLEMSEAKILLVSSVSFLGGLSSLWIIGSRLDALGSKPVLMFSLTAWLLLLAGWSLLAGQTVRVTLWGILGLQFFMGLFAALVTMSNTRLAMIIVPVMGRNHFFAIFSVVTNLSLGLAPIFWGLLIDALGDWRGIWLGVQWNRYTIFFAAAAVTMTVALALSQRLEEPEAASMEELLREILIQSPQRIWVRLWPRD